jgi:hypothetical protein
MNNGGIDMRRLTPALCLAACAIVLWTQPAAAYIGPGAGITMLGALWGVVVAVAMAVGAILFWPIRMLMRKMRKPTGPTPSTAPAPVAARDKAAS